MTATLNYEARHAMRTLYQADRWGVLSVLILHSNRSGRAWPRTKTICEELGRCAQTVVEARAWLLEHKALELVPFDKRTGDELRLPRRQFIYQLTGKVEIDGKTTPYLYGQDPAVETSDDPADVEPEVLQDRTLENDSEVLPGRSSTPQNQSISIEDSSKPRDSVSSSLRSEDTVGDVPKQADPAPAPAKLDGPNGLEWWRECDGTKQVNHLVKPGAKRTLCGLRCESLARVGIFEQDCSACLSDVEALPWPNCPKCGANNWWRRFHRCLNCQYTLTENERLDCPKPEGDGRTLADLITIRGAQRAAQPSEQPAPSPQNGDRQALTPGEHRDDLTSPPAPPETPSPHSGEGLTPPEGWRDIGTVQDHRLGDVFPYTRYYIYDTKHRAVYCKPFKRVWDAHGSDTWSTALGRCGNLCHLGVRTGQRLRAHNKDYRLWLPESVAEARPWYVFRAVDGKNVYTGPAPSKADAESLAAGSGMLTQHMPIGAPWEPWPAQPKPPRKQPPLTPLQLAIGRHLLKQPNDATIDANKPRVNKLQRLILTCEGCAPNEMPSTVQSYLLADGLVQDFIPWYRDEFRKRYDKDGDLPSGEDTLPKWYGEWIGLGKPGQVIAPSPSAPKANDPTCPHCGGTGLVDWFQPPGEPARHALPGELVSYSTPCTCGKGKAA